MGLGWVRKSLNAPLLRAPLCGANNIKQKKNENSNIKQKKNENFDPSRLQLLGLKILCDASALRIQAMPLSVEGWSDIEV